MSRILTDFKTFLELPQFPDDDETNRIAHTIYLLVTALSAMLLLALPFALVVADNTLTATVIILMGLVVNFVTLQIVRRGKVYLAASFYLIYAWLNSALVVAFAGGSVTIASGLFIPIIAMAVLFLGFRASLITMATTFVYLISLLIASELNLPIPQLIILNEISGWIIFLFSSFLILIPIALMYKSLLKALQTARQELSNRQNIEAELRESEERFRIISSVISDYTFSSRLNAEGGLEHILLSGAFEPISGYTPEEFLELGGWRATLHPDDVVIDERAMNELRQNKPTTSEVRIFRKNGDMRWVRVYAHPVWDSEANRLIGINGAVRDITEHKAAEDSLRENEEKYRLLYTSMNEGSGLYEVIYDEDGNAIDYRILEVNPGYLRITGHQKEEVVGKYASEIAPPRNLQICAEVVATGKPAVFEDYYPEIDKYFHSSLFHVGGSRFATIFTDITERKKAEQDLHNSEERYRALFENAPISIGLTVPRNKENTDTFSSGSQILMVNKAWEQMYDYSLEEMNQLDPYEPYQNREDRDRLVNQLQRDGFLHNYEVARRHKDGTPYYSSLSMSPFPSIGDGAFLIMEIDITERKKAEEAVLQLNTELENKAKQLSTLNKIAHDISSITDLSSTLKQVLETLQSVLPIDAFFVTLYQPETQFVSFPITYDSGQFYQQETGPMSQTSWVAQVIHSGQALLVNRTPEEIATKNKLRTRLGDTDKASASIVIAPLTIGDKTIGTISIQSYTLNQYNEEHTNLLVGAGYQIAIAVENARLYDSLQNELAERTRLEGELQEYTNRLELLVEERTQGMRRAKEQVELILDNTSDALLFANPNGDIIVTNPAFRNGFGQEDIRAIEHIIGYIEDEQQIEDVSIALLNVIQHSKSQRVTVQVSNTENGDKKDLDIALIPVRSEEDLSGILLSGRDITQQKDMERFKARFVADALHDLATPISGISMRAYLLEKSPEHITEHVQALQNQVQHLTNLLEDLRTLSRLDRAAIELHIQDANINELVQLVFDTYEPVAIDKKQSLTLKLEPSLPNLSLDKRLIERVLVNLVSNAVNYTGENKAIVIETLKDDAFVVVHVSDQGMGISAEDLPHVFERFFRTDTARENKQSGTGLGLAISKEIVELHGGTASVTSELGLGSIFTIRLPL